MVTALPIGLGYFPIAFAFGVAAVGAGEWAVGAQSVTEVQPPKAMWAVMATPLQVVVVVVRCQPAPAAQPTQ
jgi:hypothetical protein